MEVHERTFREIYQRLAILGTEVSPRGQKVLEIENFNYVLPPFVRFANFESRKLKLDYIKREFLWYLKGDPYDTSIANYAKLWGGAITKEGTINSNYGQYIFGTGNQYDEVVKTLKNDKDSRRAVIVILAEKHIKSENSDLPCTFSLSFRIRANKLNMTVRMRSQDAVFGLGSDAPCFSFIHEMLLNSLREHYPGLEYGEYYHSADSFHVYERHFDLLGKIVSAEDMFKVIDCPVISSKAEVDFLRGLTFDAIPPEFEFTNWLTTINPPEPTK